MNLIQRWTHIAAKDHRLNEQIRAREVRVIGKDRQHIGIMSVPEALRLAREAELDLVEISPQAEPPVVQIMDFGKFLYEQHKKEREAKKAQKVIEVKEIQLRPKTDPHHRGFKVRDARKWLEEGMKVKVRVRFRGREIAYPDLALEDLRSVADELADVAVVEQQPNMEGRTMLMVLAPAGKPKKTTGKKEQDSDQGQDQNQNQDSQSNEQAVSLDRHRPTAPHPVGQEPLAPAQVGARQGGVRRTQDRPRAWLEEAREASGAVPQAEVVRTASRKFRTSGRFTA